MRRSKMAIAVAFVTLFLVSASCAGEGETGSWTVNVALREFVVEPNPATVGTGEVTFVIDNQGAETHELVVVEAASAAELPVDENGAFDEESFGEVLGEVEDIATLGQGELTLNLEPGEYVLLCNIIEEEESGEIESHFAEGMHAGFTVEQ